MAFLVLNKNCIQHISSFLIARDIRELELCCKATRGILPVSQKKNLQTRYYNSRAYLRIIKKTRNGKEYLNNPEKGDVVMKAILQKVRTDTIHLFILNLIKITDPRQFRKFIKNRYSGDTVDRLASYGIAILYYKKQRKDQKTKADWELIKLEYKKIWTSIRSRYLQESSEWEFLKEKREAYEQCHCTLMCGDLDISSIHHPSFRAVYAFKYQVFELRNDKQIRWYNMESSKKFLQGVRRANEEQTHNSWVIIPKSSIDKTLPYFLTKPFLGFDPNIVQLLWIRQDRVKRIAKHESHEIKNLRSTFFGKLDYEPVREIHDIQHASSSNSYPLDISVISKESFRTVARRTDPDASLAMIDTYKDLWYDEKTEKYKGRSYNSDYKLYIIIEPVVQTTPEMMRYFLELSKSDIEYKIRQVTQKNNSDEEIGYKKVRKVKTTSPVKRS